MELKFIWFHILVISLKKCDKIEKNRSLENKALIL